MDNNDDADSADDGAIPVVQYVRMSTEHQRYSTLNQTAAIAEYAAAHGMRIIHTYTDAGKSGLSIRGRTGLRQLLDDVQASPDFQAILVYDVSRWGRFLDPDEAAVYEHMCKSRSIRVIYCAEAFSNDGSIASTVLVGIKRSMAAEYSRELSVKVFAGHCTLVQLGFRQGGVPGFGLRRLLIDEKNNRKGILLRGERKSIQTDRVILVPGPAEEIATVLQIYSLFLEGSMPERIIAATLNRQSISTDTGSPWTRGKVHQILTNEKYIGNNVYNRTSFKLKDKHQRNLPADWVRKDNAFEEIVPRDRFLQVQEIIKNRSRHLDDTQMLELLRRVLEKHGALSGIVIDEQEGIPSSSTYRSRFGSLLRAYNLVGFYPRRDYAYLRINRELRRRHPELIQEMADKIAGAGGRTKHDPMTDLLTINGEFTASLVIARCKTTSTDHYRWLVRLDASLEPDFTVVARMDHSNQHPFDYYVLPALDFSQATGPIRENNSFTLDAYRTDSLYYFYNLTGRLPLKEAG